VNIKYTHMKTRSLSEYIKYTHMKTRSLSEYKVYIHENKVS